MHLISLCFLCCWLPQVTESISYPYYTFKAQLTRITRTTWRKASAVPPFPAWREGADHVSAWRNPIPCTATHDDRAAPLHWWHNSLPSSHPIFLHICGFSQQFSGRWFLMTGAALREDGWFIIQRATNTASVLSWRYLLWWKSREPPLLTSAGLSLMSKFLPFTQAA